MFSRFLTLCTPFFENPDNHSGAFLQSQTEKTGFEDRRRLPFRVLARAPPCSPMERRLRTPAPPAANFRTAWSAPTGWPHELPRPQLQTPAAPPAATLRTPAPPRTSALAGLRLQSDPAHFRTPSCKLPHLQAANSRTPGGELPHCPVRAHRLAPRTPAPPELRTPAFPRSSVFVSICNQVWLNA